MGCARTCRIKSITGLGLDTGIWKVRVVVALEGPLPERLSYLRSDEKSFPSCYILGSYLAARRHKPNRSGWTRLSLAHLSPFGPDAAPNFNQNETLGNDS